MATITAIKTIPHTRIENTIIANMADIGVYAYAVYCAIKMHLNQATGACFPSYATIARMTGIHRSTVIDCVKKLTALKLVSPLWRYKEDGSHASNQYDFQETGSPAPSKKNEEVVKTEQGGRPEPPPLVGEDDHPGRPQRPEQVFSSNKKQRTIEDVDFYPTEKQKTCLHPTPAIVHLTDDITICNHCYGLLDETLTLQTAEKFSVERGEAEHRAWLECEASGEPEAQAPAGGRTGISGGVSASNAGAGCHRHYYDWKGGESRGGKVSLSH